MAYYRHNLAPVRTRLGLDVPYVKGYLRIDHDEDDALLETMLVAATEMADAFMENPFEYINSDGEIVQEPIPAAVETAVLKMVSEMYENRTDGIQQETVAGLGSRNWLPEYSKARELMNPLKRFPWAAWKRKREVHYP